MPRSTASWSTGRSTGSRRGTATSSPCARSPAGRTSRSQTTKVSRSGPSRRCCGERARRSSASSLSCPSPRKRWPASSSPPGRSCGARSSGWRTAAQASTPERWRRRGPAQRNGRHGGHRCCCRAQRSSHRTRSPVDRARLREHRAPPSLRPRVVFGEPRRRAHGARRRYRRAGANGSGQADGLAAGVLAEVRGSGSGSGSLGTADRRVRRPGRRSGRRRRSGSSVRAQQRRYGSGGLTRRVGWAQPDGGVSHGVVGGVGNTVGGITNSVGGTLGGAAGGVVSGVGSTRRRHQPVVSATRSAGVTSGVGSTVGGVTGGASTAAV